jgi:hypothetical protein
VLTALPGRLGELFDVRLERGVRAWAASDGAAAATQSRLDAARLAFLERTWRGVLGDPERARAAALVPHLVSIGAVVATPPLDDAELGSVFELLARLVPSVR